MTSLPILLPPNCTPVVKVGDVVTAGQVLAKKIAEKEEVVNIPSELEISISKVKKVLQKNPGDKVAVGDVIAVKKNIFGSEQAAIISKVDGIVARYERASGNLVIASSDDSLTENIISPVDGTISLCDNGQIVIQTDQDAASVSLASGEIGEGEIFILEEANLFHLDSRAIGKIVIGGNFTKELLVKGISMGAAGIVGMDILESDMEYLKQKNNKVPVMKVDEKTIRKLVGWKGKRISVDAGAKTISLI